VYFKDKNTNICFATNFSGLCAQHSVLTTVPCTRKVEKEVRKQDKNQLLRGECDGRKS